MKQNLFFAVFMLALTLTMTLFHQGVGRLYSDRSSDLVVIQEMEDRVARTELQAKVLHEQLFDYQQNVAEVLGKKDTKIASSSHVNLLSVSRLPASEETDESSARLMARGRSFFSSQKYREALGVFDQLVEKYPASPQSLEARFLRAESLYLTGELDLCVEEIETMIAQYPEYPMTGYLMIRLSQVLHHRKRSSEALEILQYVQQHFPNDRQLQTQAQSLGQKIRVL